MMWGSARQPQLDLGPIQLGLPASRGLDDGLLIGLGIAEPKEPLEVRRVDIDDRVFRHGNDAIIAALLVHHDLTSVEDHLPTLVHR
jgi:hypothetical protein